MNCGFCECETVTKRVRKQHWFKKRLYIVDDVEAEVCTECGERFFHASTLDQIDSLLSGEHQSRVKEVWNVEVLAAMS